MTIELRRYEGLWYVKFNETLGEFKKFKDARKLIEQFLLLEKEHGKD